MMSYRRRFRGRDKKRRASLMLILVLAALMIGYAVFSYKLMPILRTAAIYRAQIVAANTVNDAVGKVLREDDISYDKLMTFDKNSDGAITAVTADTLQINLLKYDITSEVIRELQNIPASDLAIPLGNVVGGQIFTGRGPMIYVHVQPIGNVISSITSSFSDAGINQTRQQIMLNVHTDIAVMISIYTVSTSVESNFCIADTVIIGSVPSYYFEGSSGSSAENAFIYGGSLSGSSSASSGAAGKSSGKTVSSAAQKS